MSNSEELARHERRRQITERPNRKEEILNVRGRSTSRVLMSEEEQEAEIKRERNDWRSRFGLGTAGV